MDKLEGTIEDLSGDISFNFEARFVFTIWPVFRFPDLIVKSFLTTGKISTDLHQAEGIVLQENGRTKLVGVAIIPPTGNKLLDFFLGLPNEALAILQCEIKSNALA